MRLLYLTCALLWLSPWSEQSSASAAQDPRRAPVYYGETSFERDVPSLGGIVTSDALERALKESGHGVCMPGFVGGLSLNLPEGEQRIRDVLDKLADVAQGEWKRVGSVY